MRFRLGQVSVGFLDKLETGGGKKSRDIAALSLLLATIIGIDRDVIGLCTQLEIDRFFEEYGR